MNVYVVTIGAVYHEFHSVHCTLQSAIKTRNQIVRKAMKHYGYNHPSKMKSFLNERGFSRVETAEVEGNEIL